jgi:hypothetical protein
MISVIVQRQPADKPGPDISDPLINSELVARERGRNAIDADYSARQTVTLDIEPVSGLRINQLVEVQDLEAVAWRSLITGISMSARRDADSVTRSQQITVEREAV